MMMQLNKSVAMRSSIVRPMGARRAAMVVRAEQQNNREGQGLRQLVDEPKETVKNIANQVTDNYQEKTGIDSGKQQLQNNQQQQGLSNFQQQQQPQGVADNYVTPVQQGDGRVVQEFHLFNLQNETINGRAAMLGFVAAVIGERLTHQTVISQVAGRYFAGGQVEHPWYASDLGFFMILSLVIIGSFAPRFIENLSTNSKSFGPFTPPLEQITGRVAMVGITGLIVVEALKGSAVF